jgi:hypothetical protein
MSLVAKLDLANLLSVQAESREETWANHRDTESDRETVLDGEIVYPGGEMENQIRTYLVSAGSQLRTCRVYAGN